MFKKATFLVHSWISKLLIANVFKPIYTVKWPSLLREPPIIPRYIKRWEKLAQQLKPITKKFDLKPPGEKKKRETYTKSHNSEPNSNCFVPKQWYPRHGFSYSDIHGQDLEYIDYFFIFRLPKDSTTPILPWYTYPLEWSAVHTILPIYNSKVVSVLQRPSQWLCLYRDTFHAF